MQKDHPARFLPGVPALRAAQLSKHFFQSLLFIFLCCCSQLLHAQQKTVTGKVSDSTGAPLPSASVTVSGTKKGVSTDVNGNFSIVVSENAALIFSATGFETQQKSVAGQQNINVSLLASNNSLENVVVIGYQTVRRKDLTGATGIVNMNDANRITSGSVGEAIQGLVPGVTVRNGGAPGSNAAIEIRGVGSFGNVNPLYVIDGMLSDANTTVNTDDIASVQILKDASAAAIYGSRAGNGVVIITTKKGKDGPTRITASAKFGSQMLPRTWNVMNADQYLQTVKQQYTNSGATLPSGYAGLSNAANTDWQKAATRTGNDQDYNLGVSGGSKNGNYLISGSYYKNQGVLIGNAFERASLRINTEARKGRLSVGENLLVTSTYGQNPGGGINAFYETPQMLPIIGIQGAQYNSIQYNPAGWGLGTTGIPTYASNYLAVAALDKQTYNYAKIIGNGYLDFKFADWLSYRFNAGAEASFDYAKEVRDTGIWRYTNQPPLTSIGETRSRFTNFLLEHTLNFNKTFGKHVINGVVGFSWTQHERTYTTASRTQLQRVNGELFTSIASALGASSTDGGTSELWRSHGYLGRVNYIYNDRYFVTLTGRIDQDSRFGPAHHTGTFPSAAVAWRISKEDFFHVDWLSDLKIRASYGRLGFSDVLGSFDYTGYLNINPRAVYGVNQTPVVGGYQASITNPDLHWETRIQKNIGFDAGLFNNRVSVSADVYNSLTKDVLVSLPVAQYLGSVGNTTANAASIRNTGVELEATYRSRPGVFHWDISGNFTSIKNRVISVGNQGVDASGSKVDYIEPNNFTRAEVGNTVGAWYVIKTAGIFQTQQEIHGYVNKSGQKIQGNAKPGDIKYVDANGDGTINNGDRQYNGSPWPTVQSGLQFNAAYKQFNLNLQFVGIFGNTIYDDVRRVLDGYQLTNFRKDINPWSTSNTGGSDPRLAVDQPSDQTVSVNNMAQTSRWLENGSYVRLRNVEIGYTFSPEALKRIYFTSVHFYITAQNLFTITKYKGLDPDVQGTGIITRGLDAGNWPSSRILSAGIQCSF